MKHLRKYESELNENLNSGVLWRDMNDKLKDILEEVQAKYGVDEEEAVNAIVQYYSTKHYKV